LSLPPGVADFLGQTVEVVVEVPRGGLVKRGADGRIDLISPLPCPFNYGSIPETRAPDGDPVDAVVLGPRLARGARVEARVAAVVRFVDAGVEDPKLICVRHATMGRLDRGTVIGFFRLYAVLKRAINAARRKNGPTRFETLRVA